MSTKRTQRQQWHNFRLRLPGLGDFLVVSQSQTFEIAKEICISDRKKACIAGVVLTSVAMAVVFGFPFLPGGFESQAGWVFALLPGSFAAYPLSDSVYNVAPFLQAAAFWTFMAVFNFAWYWMIGLAWMELFR